MRIAFGADEVSPLTESVRALLESRGEVVEDLSGQQWPDVGRGVGTLVARGDAEVGVVMCWTGTGVSIAANKVPGVRAALCTDAATAVGARRWNDANVVAMGMRLTTTAVAEEILDAFLATSPDPVEADLIASVEQRPADG